MTLSKDTTTESARLAFEEFKLFYESAEKVTERRLATNRWNYSICTAILVASAGILNWAASNPSFLVLAVLAVIVLSSMAMLFCTMWVGQIHSFKMLNTAKFEVLNQMAPRVSFSSSSSDKRISYSPFEREWEALRGKTEALEEIANTKILALKSSNIEYLIPKAFRLLFGFVIVVAIVVAVVNRDSIATSSLLAFQTAPTATPTTLPTVTPIP
jgi:hypothetical protein